jgi:hypothetical protein
MGKRERESKRERERERVECNQKVKDIFSHPSF